MISSMSPLHGTFSNPILPGFNPDPSIIRVGASYFLTTSTFEYFPGAAIYHSDDLIKWTLIGHALTRKSQLDIKTVEPGGGVWAATIRYHDGTFYITACVFDRYRPQANDRIWPRGFYVKTRDVWDSDSWSDPVYFDQVGFDQDLFWDDGLVYLSTTYRKVSRSPSSKLKDFGIHISTIDLETGNSTSPPLLIRESSSGVSEGSHIFKRGKYYYLFTAEGGTESGHCEWVMRSEKGPFGPWEVGPNNPLWRNGAQDEIQNTGHCDLVEDGEGRWWAVSLGVRPVKARDGKFHASVFGRESLLLPVEWEDDWPIFNGGRPITLTSSGPGLYQLEQSSTWRDEFDQPKLQLGWYRKNTPVKTDFQILTSPSRLRLHGSSYPISTPTCPTLFLRKQTHRRGTWSTQLSFHPTSSQWEAGTCVWWNYHTWCSIGIRLVQSNQGVVDDDGGNGIRVLRFRDPDGVTTDIPLRAADGESAGHVTLVIEAQDLEYRLGFLEPGKAEEAEGNSNSSVDTSGKLTAGIRIRWVGEVTTDLMTRDPPVGAPFTGMMFGVYAFGELEPCLVPADFQYAEFRAER